MSKKISPVSIGFISGLLVVCAASAYESSRGPTELIYWDPQKANAGYTMVKPQRVQGVYLIDMAGQVVNHWPDFHDAYLQDDGTIFGSVGNRTFAIQDWDGNTLWQYPEQREGYNPHHDFLRVYNAELQDYTILYIANAPLTHNEAIALGANPDAADSYDDAQMDTIVEVDRSGTVVWEWRFRDHLVQDIDSSKANYVGNGNSISDYPGRLDINWGVVSPDYQHVNGIDYNPDTGHLAISSNRTHEIYIVDHDGTFVAGDPEQSHRLAASEAGDFLYRFGNPAIYGQGEYPHYAKKNSAMEEFSGHKQIGGNHDIQWIKEGLAGAGNLLLFNNGLTVPRAPDDSDPQSEFFEFNPYLDANGVEQDHYVNPPEAGYTDILPGTDRGQDSLVTRLFSKQIISTYNTTDGFNSHHGSSLQRLPNGNTLVQLARVGRMVEVTPDGEVVWEYVNPLVYSGEAVKTLVTSNPDHQNTYNGWSPLRWMPDYPGLVGKDLSAKGPITDIHGTSVLQPLPDEVPTE
jgi:hypothetical protein